MFVTKHDLYAPSEISAQKKTNEIFNELESQVIRGKKLSELFAYDDVSLWWFIHPTIYLSVKESLSFIDSFQEFIEKHKPSEVIVASDFNKFALIQQICKKFDIKVSYLKIPYIQFQILS